MAECTSVSVPSERHVRQLVDHIDWTEKNPVLLAEGVKESLAAVFPWMSDKECHQLPQEYIQLHGVRRIKIGLHDFPDVLPSLIGCKWLQAVIITPLRAKLFIYKQQVQSLPGDISHLCWLQELYICGNRLGDLPQSLYQCKQLETLDVSGNKLHSLHEDIGCLGCVKKLHVQDNKLTSLPQSLYKCKQLEILDVSSNQLHSLHEDIGCLSCLKKIHARFNQLTSLPQSLYQCKQLDTLDVSGNELLCLPEDISCLRSLKKLHVQDNKLTTLPRSLFQCKQLHTLDVSNNQLHSLHEVIGYLSCLKKLHASFNKLTTLPESLHRCKQLETLDVSHNQLHSLHKDIGCLSCLKELHVCDNKLTFLPQSLYQCKQLVTLDVSVNELHSLHEDIGCLGCLQQIHVRRNKLTSLPQSLYQCKKLQMLHVSDNQLHSLHEDIGCLSCMQQLHVGYNNLTFLPQSLYQCKQLQTLDVSANELHSLHEDIGCLSSLKKLHVPLNKLTSLPQSVYQCKQLETLNVSGNQLHSLHEDIGCLSFLKTLDVDDNNLTSLPQSLYQCKQLEALHVSGNELHSAHQDIGCLSCLKKLHVHSTKLTSLPQSLYQCKQLETLDVSGNQLHTLHGDIGSLSCLKKLHVQGNNLTSLPQSLYQCKQLETLDVSDNRVHSLHEDIGSSSCLKKLAARFNNLTSLPQSLYQCKQLETLDVSGNELCSLHENISCFSCLKKLHVQDNKLTSLPQSLYQCKKLDTLDASGNKLHSLHENISCFSCLKKLHVQDNKLTSLPQSLYQCKQLETLHVSHNQLHSLHEDIGCLRSLKELHVCDNRLTSLPQSLYQCKQLETLDVSKNHLQYIHEGIGELHSLGQFNVSHNNLKNLPLQILKCTQLEILHAKYNKLNIPHAVLHSGVTAIFSYLQQIQLKGTIQNNERNLMFLGNTLAGKTSLMKSLLSGKPYLTNVEDRTHGMEKHTWVKETMNKPYPYLNIQICDFGGHASYNITTMFFLNENSLFLVIFCLGTYNPGKYRLMVGQWIEMIAEAIPNAVILLVGTHKDKCTNIQTRQILKEVLDQCNKEESVKQEQINSRITDLRRHGQKCDKLQEMLRQRPVIIQETFAVSCETFEGIEAAGNKILSILEDETWFPTKEIPLNWHHLRDLLSAQTGQHGLTPWLSWDTVKQLAIQAELKNEDVSITEALRFLKLSNDILWYDDNDLLRKTVFNQPNKLIEIFKALISHDLDQQLSNTDPCFGNLTNATLSQVKADLFSKGKLTKDLLRCIWKDFTPDEVSFEMLVMLMIKFDFGYILPRQGNCVDMAKVEEIRIPWFLRDEEPAVVTQQWPADIPTEEQQIAIKVEFRRWAPPTLLPSLCVRIQTYVTQSNEWKNGLLATTGQGIKLLLKLITENENEAILVYIRGKNLNTMWQVLLPIQREMDALLNMWLGLIFSKVVPCPGCARKMLPDPTLHTDEWLYNVCPHKEIFCDKCVNSAQLLTAVMVYPPLEVLQTVGAQYQKEDSNFWRYQKLVTEYGSEMPRRILQQHLSPQNLQEWLQVNKDDFCARISGQFKWIRRKLYPESGSVQLTDLDLTTLNFIFTRLLHGFSSPRNGWFKDPDPSDLTQAADLLRLAKLRNNLAHTIKCQLSDDQFEEKWAEAESVIVRLGGCHQDILRLKLAKLHISS